MSILQNMKISGNISIVYGIMSLIFNFWNFYFFPENDPSYNNINSFYNLLWFSFRIFFFSYIFFNIYKIYLHHSKNKKLSKTTFLQVIALNIFSSLTIIISIAYGIPKVKGLSTLFISSVLTGLGYLIFTFTSYLCVSGNQNLLITILVMSLSAGIFYISFLPMGIISETILFLIFGYFLLATYKSVQFS